MSENINQKISSLLKRVLKIERSIQMASETCDCKATPISVGCDPLECIKIIALVNLVSKLRQQIDELAMQDN